MKLLVYGATGSQGAPVAQKLIEEGHAVRVLTRHPERAQAFADQGAEVVQGDLGKPDSLEKASEGVEGVFLHVPFFTDNPEDAPTYGKNGVDAAAKAGARLIVWNTSGELPPAGTDAAAADPRAEVLRHLQESGVPYVALQPPTYMENLLGPWTREEIVQDDTFAYPTPLEVEINWLATEDVGKFAAHAFAHPELANLNLKIGGPERLNGEDIAARFSRALSRTVTFRAMPPKEFGEKLDAAFPGMGEIMAQNYQMAYDHPERFSSQLDVAALLQKMPVELTPLEQWVRELKEAFLAGASVEAS